MGATGTARAPHVVVHDALPHLIAQATHDLNNQLTTVLGQTELALMVDDSGRWKRSFAEIQGAGQAAQRLVADIQRVLTWTAPGNDPVPLEDIVELVQRLTQRRAEQKNVTLQVVGDVPGPIHEGAPEIALSLWFLLNQALQQSAGEPADWTIRLEQPNADFTRLTLDTPGTVWDANTVRSADRSQRIGSSPPSNAMEYVFACLYSIGARAGAKHASFYAEVRR